MKTWYNIILVEDNEEDIIVKVKSKGLAYLTIKMLEKEVYNNERFKLYIK